MKKLKRFVWVSLFIVISFIFCAYYYVVRVTKPYTFSSIEDIPHKKTGLLLGTTKKGKHGENPYFTWRIDAAVALLEAGKVDEILISGDNSTESYNETQDMFESLLERGVDSDQIRLDYAGFRTLDSVIRAKKVFNCSELIIISQEFHNQRALYIALMNEIDAVAFNAKDSQHKNNYTHYREVLAKAWTVLEVHLFGTQPKFL